VWLSLLPSSQHATSIHYRLIALKLFDQQHF
jgi:hypothetical protein